MSDVRTIGVAIAIPEPYGGQLQRCRESYGDPDAHAIPTHITLLPPTQLRESQLDAVDAHLRAAAGEHEPFSVLLRGTGSFRPVSPVVFVEVAEGISPCERLEASIRSGPLARRLQFPYHPHVTVAHDVPEDMLEKAADDLAEYTASFVVYGYHLYEHGADQVWRPMRDYALGQQVPGPTPPV